MYGLCPSFEILNTTKHNTSNFRNIVFSDIYNSWRGAQPRAPVTMCYTPSSEHFRFCVCRVFNFLSGIKQRHVEGGGGGIMEPFFTSALAGRELSASRPGHFAAMIRLTGTHWIGGWLEWTLRWRCKYRNWTVRPVAIRQGIKNSRSNDNCWIVASINFLP